MTLQVPPALLHFLGAMLVVFGVLRAYHLGWRRREPPFAGDDEGAEKERVERFRRDAKRHIRWGVLWVAMGLFLIISTAMNS